jgi:hypothetical protein
LADEPLIAPFQSIHWTFIYNYQEKQLTLALWDHRNLCTRAGTFICSGPAKILAKKLAKSLLISTLGRQGILFHKNNFSGLYKPLFTTQKRVEIS